MQGVVALGHRVPAGARLHTTYARSARLPLRMPSLCTVPPSPVLCSRRLRQQELGSMKPQAAALVGLLLLVAGVAEVGWENMALVALYWASAPMPPPPPPPVVPPNTEMPVCSASAAGRCPQAFSHPPCPVPLNYSPAGPASRGGRRARPWPRPRSRRSGSSPWTGLGRVPGGGAVGRRRRLLV